MRSAIKLSASKLGPIAVATHSTEMTGSSDALSSSNRPAAAEGGLEIREHAVRGAAWMMALRWAVRLLSIVNTAILARLLTPADFGLMAMANMAMAVVAILGLGGEDLALIRMGRPSDEYLNAAWSFKILMSTALFVCTLALAPLARLYFNSKEVELLIYAISIRILLNGFVNIGVVYFRIDLDFAKEFRYLMYRKVADVLIVIPSVLVVRSVWGLAIAAVLAKAVEIALSFIMHPFRPRFGLSRIHEIWSFSFWTLIVGIGGYFAGKADQYIVGATTNPTMTGAYTVGSELAVTPSVDLIEPVMRAMFPVYSRLLGDPERLGSAAALVIGASATVCLATGPGMSGIAREMTLLLLGNQWGQVTSLAFWFGIGAIPVGMNFCIYSIMNVTNKFRLTTMTVWGRLALLVPTLIVAGCWGGAPAIAAAQAGLGFVALFADLFLLSLAIQITAAELAGCLYRPAIAAAAMVLVLQLIDHTTQFNPLPAVLTKIACGAVAYLGTIFFLWKLGGRPDGIEALGLETVARLIGNNSLWQSRLKRE
jgi:O-antigen/teichoic acid export membrane protein